MSIDKLSNLIISLQKDFSGFKTDLSGFKKDLSDIKIDFNVFKDHVKDFKNEFNGLKQEFRDFRNETTENFEEVYSKLDNHTAAIMSLENTVGFYGDMYKMNREKIDNHEKRISFLEAK